MGQQSGISDPLGREGEIVGWEARGMSALACSEGQISAVSTQIESGYHLSSSIWEDPQVSRSVFGSKN